MEKLLNQVMNEDCLEVMKRMPDESVDLILTDPPYNMNYFGRVKGKFKGFDNDNLTPEEHSIWFDKVLSGLFKVLKINSAIYVFIDYRNYARIYPLIDKYFTIKNCIVWDKTSIGMGQGYRFQHEFIIYAVKGKPHLNFVKRNVADIWHVKRKKGYKHPTQKPVEIMSLPIQYSSNVGDIVFDPFLGSGTSAIASIGQKRNFIGCEVDKEYCELANSRIEDVSKEQKLNL